MWLTDRALYVDKHMFSRFKDVGVPSNTSVTILGLAQSIRWDRSESDVTIHVPALSVDEVPWRDAYAFRITHVQ